LPDRFLPLDGLFFPRERAFEPVPCLFSFFFALGSHSFLLIVGKWEVSVVVSEAHAWKTSFRVLPREEALRWPLEAEVFLPLPPRRSFLPLGLRLFCPRRDEELDCSEFLKIVSSNN
jgi:hypothetical protein